MSRIVVATCDTLTTKMAGPAIRAWQMAVALSVEHEVRLVTTTRAGITHPAFEVQAVDDAGLAEAERWCDVFVFQGWVMHGRPYLLSTEKVVVVDVYDPLHLEQLEQGRDDGPRGRLHSVESSTAVLNEQLLRADFALCATESQRDFWLGHLAALGRINPVTYDSDPTLRSLIDVAPFGIPAEPPVHSRTVMKGVVSGIGVQDKVILWGGGIYNWFDPLTLLHAIDLLRRRVPTVRLVFMGLRHPNADIPTMSMATEARRLADKLALTGTHVFFNEGWVDYDDRQNYLTEADVGVSTHLDCVESAMSYRTRVLDYLWASLPVVVTDGDALARLVSERELGVAVAAGDVDGLADALGWALEDTDLRARWRANTAGLQPELVWSRALEPLVRFCRNPRRAPDLLDPDIAGHLRMHLTGIPDRWLGLRHDFHVALEHLRTGGPQLAARKALGRARRVARRVVRRR